MRSRAAGFTLAELLVVTLIGAVVLAAVYQTLTMQERSNRQQLAVVSTQQNTRMAISLLTSDLREVSAADGDILDATSSSIRYRALRKAGVICNKDYSGNSWANVATYSVDPFENGDTVLIYMEGTNKVSANDDYWSGETPVVNNTGNSGYCLGNSYGAMMVNRIHFNAGVLAQADTGALVRSISKVGYRLVDDGGSGTLFRMEGLDSMAIVQSLATVANQGLRFRYFNAAGTEFDPSTPTLRSQIMRIEIKARGIAAGGQTGAQRMFSDSLIGQVFLRGNRKTS